MRRGAEAQVLNARSPTALSAGDLLRTTIRNASATE